MSTVEGTVGTDADSLMDRLDDLAEIGAIDARQGAGGCGSLRRTTLVGDLVVAWVRDLARARDVGHGPPLPGADGDHCLVLRATQS